MASDGTIMIDVDFDVNTNQLMKSLNNVGSHANSITKGIGSTIASVSKVAISAITASATALSGLGIAAYTEGKKFESAFAGVKKTVDGTEAEFEMLKNGILEMSERLPESASDIASVAEAAGQLGIATDGILGFTETMVQLGTATNLTADEAASQLAKFANITKMSVEDYDNLGSAIVALGNNFATTEADIVNMAMRIASTGAVVGLSESEIMALSAALSSVGIEAEAGGSAMSRVLKDIETAVKTGSTELSQFAEVSGMTREEFATAWSDSPVRALDAFVTGLNDTERNGKSAIEVLEGMGITEVRLSNALLSLSTAGGLMTKAVDLSNTAWNENNALTKETAQRYETLDSKIGMLKSSAQNLGIIVYEGMEMPLKSAVDKGIQYIGRLQNAFKFEGIGGAVEEFANIFSEVLAQGAMKLPEFMKMGSDFVLSLCNGIRNNADAIFDSFVNVILQLPDFILSNASALFSVGNIFVDKLAQGISQNANSIGTAAADLLIRFADFIIYNIPKITRAAIQVVKAFATEIGRQVPILKPFASVLNGILKIVDKFGEQIASAVVAVMAFKKTATVITTITKLTSALKQAKDGAGLFKTAISAMGGPVTALIGITTGLVTAIVSYTEAQKAAKREKIREEFQKTTESVSKLKDAVEETTDRMAELSKSASRDISEITNTSEEEKKQVRELLRELDEYVDKNGKVKDGYEDRANIILGKLATATDSEISQIEDGVIPAYNELASAVENAMKKKQALAEIDALSDEYNEAKTSVEDYVRYRNENEPKLNEAQKAVDDYIRGLESAVDAAEKANVNFASNPALANMASILSIPLTMENKDQFKGLMPDETWFKMFEVNDNGDAVGYVAQIEQISDALATFKANAESGTYALAKFDEAKQALAEGNYDKVMDTLKQIGDETYKVLNDTSKSLKEKQTEVQSSLEETFEIFKMNMEAGATETAKEYEKAMIDLIAQFPEYGLDAADAWTLEFLEKLAEIEGFDNSKLIDFLGQTGTQGGKIAGRLAMEKVRDEMRNGDYNETGGHIGRTLGSAMEAEFGPFLRSISGSIIGLQAAASGLSGVMAGVAAQASSITLPTAGGSSGNGSSSTNNYYNASMNGKTTSEKSQSFKNSIKKGVGG